MANYAVLTFIVIVSELIKFNRRNRITFVESILFICALLAILDICLLYNNTCISESFISKKESAFSIHLFVIWNKTSSQMFCMMWYMGMQDKQWSCYLYPVIYLHEV